ncbi:LacI family DNA-binding transcriptional regulator [Vibrio nigripulchritudo]|uniref:LacI family DNA-binding transcriptional regulator n=1 Tax=Vibrio nigripulchritudo TaxID=28173 RepID=UPI0003B1D1EB|nr:LacI family DNA-binding transcriptional regulator [Vibrio nigripulchritudo]CCN73643.1 putative Transcriptional regulator, LacI family [Vibrio nigripulchritudo SFn118]
MKKKATLQDVADLANVSGATVSKFINGQKSFTAKVETSIKNAIETLGYQQNPAARAIATGKNNALGLAILDICNPHYANLVRGASKEALKNGYNLLLSDLNQEASNSLNVLKALSMRVDGLIVSRRMPDRMIEWARTQNIPLVFICSTNDSDVPSVGIDVNELVTMQFNYLVSLGHSQITYIGYDGSALNRIRKAKLKELAEISDVSLRLLDAKTPTLDGGKDIALEAIEGSDKRAIISYNDQVAIAIVNIALEKGINVPNELAVIGADNISTCSYLTPKLTTVDTKGFRQGEESLKKLLAIINGKKVEKETKITPELVIRSST